MRLAQITTTGQDFQITNGLMYFASQIQTFYGIFIEVQLGTVQIYSKKNAGSIFDIIFTHKIFVRAQIGADWHSRDML